MPPARRRLWPPGPGQDGQVQVRSTGGQTRRDGPEQRSASPLDPLRADTVKGPEKQPTVGTPLNELSLAPRQRRRQVYGYDSCGSRT